MDHCQELLLSDIFNFMTKALTSPLYVSRRCICTDYKTRQGEKAEILHTPYMIPYNMIKIKNDHEEQDAREASDIPFVRRQKMVSM